MKIVHISDLHFPCKLPALSLRGKMVAGYANYTLRRKNAHPQQITQAMLDFIRQSNHDILVISGDLTNVSHELEFANSRKILDPVLDQRAFVIPGNHDRYHKKALQPEDLFLKYFGEFSGESIANAGYIRVKKIKDMAFVGWDSSKPGSLFQASGNIAPDVVENTKKYIKKNKIRNYFLVCHHPFWNPEQHRESNNHRLQNREMIIESLRDLPPEIVFYGHSHHNWISKKTSEMPFWTINSASSSRVNDKKHFSGIHVAEFKNGKTGIERYTFSQQGNRFIKASLIEY